MSDSITSANATILLTIPQLFPVPQQIQGFSADNIFDNESVNTSDASMGLDGQLAVGFVFVAVPWGIELQANSDSNLFFESWNAAERTLVDKLRCDGVVQLPATGRIYTMTKGFLTLYPTMPNAQKALRPRKYGILWERVSPAAV